jgi:energy-coupling factor transporter ATP-binding protein EcfA2
MKITKLHAENVHGYLPIDVSFFDDLTFLTGLNGSGKTSALRLLMALLTPNINELGDITFSLAEVTVLDNGQEIVVTAKKTVEGVELRISTIEDTLLINRAELELFLEAKRGDEPGLKVREMYQSSPVFHSISKMSTPMFLGLDRRFFAPGSIRDDFDDFRRREFMMAKRFWPEDSASRNTMNVASNLIEVNYLVVARMQEIRVEQEQLDENLRREFFTKAFEYKPSDFLSSGIKSPSKSELDNYRYQLTQIEQNAEGNKIPVPEIQSALTDFFEKMGRVIDSLRDNDSKKEITKNKNNYPKDKRTYQQPQKKEKVPNNALVEWIINKPQADRILEHLHLLNNYIENRKSLRNPIIKFSSLVNSFLEQTKKQVAVGDNGQLTIQVIGNSDYSRTINALSSGERQLLVMLAHLSFNPNLDGSGVFIVDEPELSLHIDWQEKFVDAIREANPKVQLILATHSPEIILDRIEACIGMNEIQQA